MVEAILSVLPLEQFEPIAAFRMEVDGAPGELPTVIGEFGIPYEMNDREAYRTGDWSAQEVCLDASYRAMDALLLHTAQWNYTADNSHAHGDQWNDEDRRPPYAAGCVRDQRGQLGTFARGAWHAAQMDPARQFVLSCSRRHGDNALQRHNHHHS